jgi:Protein of unknown function (DUF1553)/Protein of unknown function (DUF1549)/Planctomycete cytochrome C
MNLQRMRVRYAFRWGWPWLGAACLAGACASSTGAQNFDFFEKRIRPVLAEHCYPCHSESSQSLKGGLHLDSRAGLLQGGDSGQPALVPGDAERSRLLEAVRRTNPDLSMPPKEKEKLSDVQISDLTAWVKMGAPMPADSGPAGLRNRSPAKRHWAFQFPRAYPLPEVRDVSWPQTPLDQFILAKLEAHGLKPSPRADKRTLIRRATYDLTGLPPRPEEVASFLADESPEAFARVVDRLLASPHYGERWGRYWLDVARYADTKGYVYSDREEGRFVQASTYRNWVIRALNEDMPYDRFLMLQIAADQMGNRNTRNYPDWIYDTEGKGSGRSSAESNDGGGVSPEDRADLAALGFLTLGRRFLGVVHDIIDDRIDVVARGTLGLTVGCARCHDHKYDPIPTRDYYSWYGVFNGSYERTVPLGAGPRGSAAYEAFEKGLEERVAKLETTFQNKREELESRLRQQAPRYLAAVLDADRLPTEEFYEIRGPDDLNPTIVRQWQSFLAQTRAETNTLFAPWNALAGLKSDEFQARAPEVIKQMASGPSEEALSINPLVIQALTASPPTSMRDVADRYGKLLARADQAWREQTRSTNSTTGRAELTRLPDPALETVRQVLYGSGSPAQLPPGAIVDLEWFFDEKARVELGKAQREIEGWILKSSAAPPYAVILQDRPVQKNPHVFLRGNPANRGPEVPRRFLEVLSGPGRRPFTHGSGRLELARAIASRDNPLTARVMVNRVWLHHFGAGLVETPSDFGTRCAPPSHPKLLDWLALRFMEEGWSIKKLHRLIMLSSVYQQQSGAPAEAQAARVDPENRWLWRMNPRRLDFEAMRDSLLAVSGRLDLSLGGRAADLFQKPFSARRSVYGHIDRQFLPGVLRMFDYANPDMHSPERAETTVPQQALFFLNSPFVLERAQALAAESETGNENRTTPEARVRRLFALAFQREPSPIEVGAGLEFLRSAQAEPRPEPPKPVVTAWQYGFGELDESGQRMKSFQPLPHFTGEAWQGGPDWPDATLGWVRLTAEGGHAGNDLRHAAIRRWVAPRQGMVSVEATLKHEHTEGDGIRAFIVSSRSGLLGKWTLQNETAKTDVASLTVEAGDTLDFVVDIRGSLNSDDFHWAPLIRERRAGRGSGVVSAANEWDAKKEFTGPPPTPPEPLTPWERYAQVLLLSNEFMFVD